jgi:hypothetical protein
VRRFLRLSLVLALSAAVLAPAAAGSAPACAAQASGAPHAALVVGTGSGTTTYCVALDATTVTGIHLIQLAGSQYGLRYRLGFGGQAVCQLSGVGPSGGDCFADYPDFWGYWHGDGQGSWAWAGSGAASASIGSGDMDGWVWGSGDSGATHASPPELAFDDVCDDRPSSPTPTPAPGGSGGADGGGSGGQGGGQQGGSSGDDIPGDHSVGDDPPDSETPGSRSDRGADDHPGGPTGTASPSLAATPSITAATPVTALASGVTRDGGGPPAGAFLAVLAILLLGIGGWFLRRRNATTGGD